VKIKVICGKFNDIQGPTKDIVIEPEYFDISVPPNTTHEHLTKQGHTVFIYVIEGKGFFSDTQNESVENESIVLFEDGDKVSVFTREHGVRFLFMSGKPIGEPVAWRGPIVMNTQEELDLAFEEYRNGTFTKH
jgi:redox-sensitive bicupin YhaK (pirin superfamily)